MAERSTMQLLSSRLGATQRAIEDITWACWPTYRRVTLADGGDFEATWQFTADDRVLEAWFDDYLGADFVETASGDTAFTGRVDRMVLAYRGRVLLRDLAPLRNSVRVRYKTDSAAADSVTGEALDSASQLSYGAQQLVQRAGVFLSSAGADTYRDNLLAALKLPRAVPQTLQLAERPARSAGTLHVTARGYVCTLKSWLVKSASTGTDSASDEITEALAGASYVTAGVIASNAIAVVEEVDYVPAWDRIRSIAALGDAAGNRYQAGCYASAKLDYGIIDAGNVGYFVELTREARLSRVTDSAGNAIPPALVRPGRVALAGDIMGGAPLAPVLLDDPRAHFIDRVIYDAAGVRIDSSQQSGRQLAIEIALMQR